MLVRRRNVHMQTTKVAVLISAESGNQGSLGAKVVKLLAFLTNLFPLWVLAAGVLGLYRPAALAWLSSDKITYTVRIRFHDLDPHVCICLQHRVNLPVQWHPGEWVH